MSIQSIQGSTQSNELYQIHKKSELQQAEQEQLQAQEVTQTDEYDKDNPVGQEAEGVYSVSYDDEGNLKVNYTQPGEKSGTQSSGNAQSAGGTGQVSGTEESDSDSDDDSTEEKIEELEKQRDQIKQQLNKEQDEDVKKSLRAQLQAIEAQITQLTAQLEQ